MSKVFVVQSAEGHYYSKQGLWLSGKDAGLIYFGKYKDEALNQLLDITIKDINVRARVLEVDFNPQRRQPLLEILVETDLIDTEEVSQEEVNLKENEQKENKVVSIAV